ncbi:MAG: arsenic-transporting ATPase [Candidatus Aenigmatarchaeota archaeon]|nr:MAG: arsenic-transporting ATPase [Candidatus Aenigmarchaeota archaeon]
MGIKDRLVRKKETQFFFYSGKGGVGKTSMAAATAMHFAGKGKKTLIISTDPAHSLSDSFEKPIGGEVTKLGKNLYGLEIDPKKALQEYKDKLSPQLEKIEALRGLGLDDAFDVTGMAPGIDEIASFDKFLQYMNSNEYDVIVFDTAPTGHALRFLSLPDVLDSWVGKIINIRLRFSGVIDTFKKILPFGEEEKGPEIGTGQLEAMKERICRAKEILSDPKKTHYNIVMIPEEMSIFESERSIDVLKEYGIPVESVIVNQLIPRNSKCDFCMEKRKIQQERLKTIKSKFGNFSVLEMPLLKEEVKGRKALEKAGKTLYG